MDQPLSLKDTIESVRGEAQWKLMSLAEFEDSFVTPINQLSENELLTLIGALNQQSFAWFTKKCWTEQDMQPTEGDTNYSSAYERSKPIMIALKRCLLLRMHVERSPKERAHLEQQLAIISLILRPDLVAQKTGLQAQDS